MLRAGFHSDFQLICLFRRTEISPFEPRKTPINICALIRLFEKHCVEKLSKQGFKRHDGKRKALSSNRKNEKARKIRLELPATH